MKFHIAPIFRLLRCNPADLKGWDTSASAAKRSFLLALPVLPVYLLTLDSLAKSHLAGVPLAVAVPVLATDYILQWVTFPLAMALLLDLTKFSYKPFTSFVIVNNFLSMFSAYALVPLLLAFRMGLLPADAMMGIMSIFFMLIAMLVSRWAMLLFDAGIGFAVIVFLISNLTGQMVSLTTLELLKLYQNPP